jgi:hypothetical protein
MNWITLLQITGLLFLGAAGYLLCVASGRASASEERVAEILGRAEKAKGQELTHCGDRVVGIRRLSLARPDRIAHPNYLKPAEEPQWQPT